jgi:single-stranded DNA-binding protein
MTINRVTLAGFTGKDAPSSSTQNGRSMTKLSVATTKRYKDVQQHWQKKTQWRNCVVIERLRSTARGFRPARTSSSRAI